MNSLYTSNIIRFVIVIIVQVIIFQNVFSPLSFGHYIHVFFYPLFILLLPIRIPSVVLLLLGFLLGMIIDLFYSSPGVHTSALVFICFVRPYLLGLLEPRQRYEVQSVPTSHIYGMPWFITYSSILMFLHCFFYFSVEVFTFVHFFNILLKTVIGTIISLIFIIVYQLIFNPK